MRWSEDVPYWIVSGLYAFLQAVDCFEIPHLALRLVFLQGFNQTDQKNYRRLLPQIPLMDGIHSRLRRREVECLLCAPATVRLHEVDSDTNSRTEQVHTRPPLSLFPWLQFPIYLAWKRRAILLDLMIGTAGQPLYTFFSVNFVDTYIDMKTWNICNVHCSNVRFDLRHSFNYIASSRI